MTRRDVSLTLTPFAPGTAGHALGSAQRTLTLYAVEPGEAVRALCDRLERPPTALACADLHGTVQVMGRVEGMREAQPLAWIAYGLTAAELQHELEAERFRRVA